MLETKWVDLVCFHVFIVDQVNTARTLCALNYLSFLYYCCSEETRIKISAGVREGWRKRHEMLMVQEGCFFEWQNCIADSARRGCAGEGELQWDSYKILNEQLKRQWLESMEKRKTKLRTKESKRAPKSPEQRRKISEAIAAKWADAVITTFSAVVSIA